MSIRKFEAIVALPFGIKQGQILTYENGILRTSEGRIVPMNPTQEEDFLKEIPFVGKFPLGSAVTTVSNQLLKPLSYHRKLDIPAWSQLTIVRYEKQKSKLLAIVEFNGREYQFAESALTALQAYYFISSSGVVQKSYVAQDQKAESFRKLVGNYYDSKEDAHTALSIILETPQQSVPLVADQNVPSQEAEAEHYHST